jgi:hypothetical protein
VIADIEIVVSIYTEEWISESKGEEKNFNLCKGNTPRAESKIMSMRRAMIMIHVGTV